MIGDRIPAGTNTLHGIDVSHYEPIVDWKQVAAMGQKFAFAKATDGSGSVDTKFTIHRAGAKANGMVFGAYHFLRFGKDPVAQAAAFIKTAGGPLKGDLPHTVDVEWDNSDPRYSNGKQMDPHAADVALAMLEQVEKLTGMTPIIYTAASFFQGFPHPERFARFPLWVANYGVKDPMCPLPFKTWKFWQYTDHEDVKGAGKIDASIFNGTLADLKALTRA